MERLSRDAVLMEMAHSVAKRGTCSRLQVGVVFSRDGRTISTGYNGAPTGLPHCEHAEWSPGSGTEAPPRIAAWIKGQLEERTPGEWNPMKFMTHHWYWIWESGSMRFIQRGDEIPGCSISEHAERNGVAFAARHGVALDGCTMHVTHGTCRTCAMAVINAGVTRVVYDIPYRITAGVELLEQAGIEVLALSH